MAVVGTTLNMVSVAPWSHTLEQQCLARPGLPILSQEFSGSGQLQVWHRIRSLCYWKHRPGEEMRACLPNSLQLAGITDCSSCAWSSGAVQVSSELAPDKLTKAISQLILCLTSLQSSLHTQNVTNMSLVVTDHTHLWLLLPEMNIVRTIFCEAISASGT